MKTKQQEETDGARPFDPPRKRKNNGRKGAAKIGGDNADARNACLTCPYESCAGNCDRIVIALAHTRKGESRKYQLAQKLWLIDRWLDGYGIKELAEVTGVPVGTVTMCVRGTPALPPLPDLPPAESLREEWEALAKTNRRCV